jgi:WD40 repeat protein
MYVQLKTICLGMTFLFALTGYSLAQDTPSIIWTIQAHGTSIESVSFAADGLTIVSAAVDEARSWQSLDGGPLNVFPGHGAGVISTDISPDGEHLAVGYIVSGYPPGGVVNLWDMESETVLYTHGGCYVSFSPGGTILASGGGGVNRTVYLHDVASGEQLASYYNGSGYITDVAYAPDGKHLAVSNTHNEVRLWDTRTHTVVRTFSGHTDDVRCLAFSPDGQLLAAGAGGWDEPSDSTIKIWRIADGQLVLTLPGQGEWTNTLAFHPGGQLLASSGRDTQTPYSASIRFWSLPDGDLVQEYDGLAGDLAFSPDGQSFCFGRTDGSLVLAGIGLSPVNGDGRELPVPAAAQLSQNFPNPFNPTTVIPFYLETPGHVDLQIFTASGRRVVTLIQDRLPHGRHEIMWHGLDASGGPVASGLYFYRLEALGFSETRRMMLVR